MKKSVFIFLILLGFVVGGWLAKENREFFEVMGLIERPKQDMSSRSIDVGALKAGMEGWQVQEAFGPPEKRNVEMATQDVRKEQWIYDDKCLYFTNGVLTSWQQMPAGAKVKEHQGRK